MKVRKVKRQREIRFIKTKMQVVGRHEDLAGNVYRTKNGDYMDILKISGTPGVARFTGDETNRLIDNFKSGIRTLTKPSNFIILDFLVNHQPQINYYGRKLELLEKREKNTTEHEKWIKQDLANLEYRQQHTTEQQFFHVIFGATVEELNEQRETALQIPRINAKVLPVAYKDALIKKINNLNSMVTFGENSENDENTEVFLNESRKANKHR